jgi:hypothetical protein
LKKPGVAIAAPGFSMVKTGFLSRWEGIGRVKNDGHSLFVFVFWQSPDESGDWEKKARLFKKLIKTQASFARSLASANGFNQETNLWISVKKIIFNFYKYHIFSLLIETPTISPF